MWRRLITTPIFRLPFRAFAEKLSREEKDLISKALLTSGLNKEFGMKDYKINEDIQIIGSVSIINSNDRFMKVGTAKEALQLANDQGVDAVLVSTEPPVIKLCEVANLILKKAGGDSENRESPLTVVNFNITEHDLKTKIKHICNMLEKTELGRVEVATRGRNPEAEIARAKELANDIHVELSDKYKAKLQCQILEEERKIILKLRLPQGKSGVPMADTQEEKSTNPGTSWNLKKRLAPTANPNADFSLDLLITTFDSPVEESSDFENPELRAISEEEAKELGKKAKEAEVKRILGTKLAYKVLKGKVKV